MPLMSFAVLESALEGIPAKGPNRVRVRAPLHPGKYLSILPDGTVAESSNDGEYEVGVRVGNKVVWSCKLYPTGAFAVVVAEGL